MASFEPRGSTTRVVISLPGGKKKTRTFDTLIEAEAWAADQEKKKAVGALRAGEAAGVTVGELFEEYEDRVASTHDASKSNKLRLSRWLLDPLAKKRLGQVKPHDINDWIARRLASKHEKTGKPIEPATVNRELNLMSAAFTYAVRDREWLAANPVHGARRPEQGRPRKRALLTPDEIEAICIASGYRHDTHPTTLIARVGACFLLALETGMRSGEILRLRPRDYARAKRIVHVAAVEVGGRKGARSGRTQADPSRDVPLTERAIELLDQLLASMPKDQEARPGFTRPPYIVGVSDQQRDALWRKARDRAGIEDLHYHDTKHEACTKLARFLDVIALSHAVGTKSLKLLRDTYYAADAERSASLLPPKLTSH